MNWSRLVFLTLLLGSSVSQATAGLIVYTDRAAFNAALPSGFPVVNEDFSGAAAGDTQIPVNTTFDVGAFNVRYSTAGGVDEPTNDIVNSGGVQELRLQWHKTGTAPTDQVTTQLQFLFDGPTLAFGADWGTSSDADFTLQDGNMFTLTVGTDTVDIDAALGDLPGTGQTESGFVGFISTNRFTSFELTMTPVFSVNSFSVDNVALLAVPEPTSLWLLLPLAAATLRRRSRCPKAAAASVPDSSASQ